MAESIFVRVARIVSGKIEDTVDAMEAAGGTTVMREAIREVDRIVDDVKSERDAVTVRRLQTVRQQKLYEERLSTLQEKAEFAMEQGREDLAEAALIRQVEFESQMDKLAEAEVNAADQERELEEALATLELRKANMEEELKAYEAASVEAGFGKDGDIQGARKKENRVERAEAAFDRAMSNTGARSGIGKVDLENHAKLGEIDSLQRSSTIAERMAKLRDMKKAS
ncbi:MAG: PspA/IM30 family protein [Salaquimonas sp.]